MFLADPMTVIISKWYELTTKATKARQSREVWKRTKRTMMDVDT